MAALVPSSGEEPAPPRHRAGVASMAWRTTNDAATASGPLRRRRRAARGARGGSRRPKTHQRRRRDARSPTTTPHHQTARNATILRISPVLSEPGPDAVRIHSESKKKPPPAIIPGTTPVASMKMACGSKAPRNLMSTRGLCKQIHPCPASAARRSSPAGLKFYARACPR